MAPDTPEHPQTAPTEKGASSWWIVLCAGVGATSVRGSWLALRVSLLALAASLKPLLFLALAGSFLPLWALLSALLEGDPSTASGPQHIQP